MSNKNIIEVDVPRVCEYCKEEVIFENRRPPDFFCFSDSAKMILIALGLALILGFYWLKFVIFLAMIIGIYLMAKHDQFCPECKETDDDTGNMFCFFSAIMMAVYFVLNLVVMFISSFFISGDGYQGSIVKGKYYLGHGAQDMLKEVSRVTYELSLFNIQLNFLLGGSLVIWSLYAKATN